MGIKSHVTDACEVQDPEAGRALVHSRALCTHQRDIGSVEPGKSLCRLESTQEIVLFPFPPRLSKASLSPLCERLWLCRAQPHGPAQPAGSFWLPGWGQWPGGRGGVTCRSSRGSPFAAGRAEPGSLWWIPDTWSRPHSCRPAPFFTEDGKFWKESKARWGKRWLVKASQAWQEAA